MLRQRVGLRLQRQAVGELRNRLRPRPPLCRAFCAGETSETPAPARQVGTTQLFSAEPPKESSGTQNSIDHARLLMATGIGTAFLGIAPFTSPNFFMVGLLLATVQVHFGYAFMQRMFWTQRRRYVLHIERTEDESGLVSVLVKCDAKLTRSFELTEQAASGKNPSLADIISKGGDFMFVDRETGTISHPEMLDELLQSDRGIQNEKVEAEPVLSESKEETLKIVQKFADLTREHLEKIPEKDGKTSPQKALKSLEHSSRLVGAGFMVGGLLTWIMGSWSSEAAIRAAGEKYKPPANSPAWVPPPEKQSPYPG